jgi:hypothetical protein
MAKRRKRLATERSLNRPLDINSHLLAPSSAPFNGAPGEIRTPDPLVRSQMLYPIELRAQLLKGN